MRIIHPKPSLEMLCSLFGKKRQSYYEALGRGETKSMTYEVTASLIKEVKEDIPGLGGVKMHKVLAEGFKEHKIKLGRDKFLALWRFYGFAIRRGRRRIAITTDSFHWLRKYTNLIEVLKITAPEQLWVSDITYIRTGQGFSYLSLITDAYSRKIVGYAMYPTLEARGCLEALSMAIAGRKPEKTFNLIHHSDRGIQYCCAAYVDMLITEGIAISMTQSGSPYENAMAERINETVKLDYFPGKMYENHKEATIAINRIVESYNERRPHQSIDYLTPGQAHTMEGPIIQRWKTYPRKPKTKEETSI